MLEDFEKTIADDLEKFINMELLIEIMTKNGWHRVIASIRNKSEEDEITIWLSENAFHKYIGYSTIWAFEDYNEYLEFLLRFGK